MSSARTDTSPVQAAREAASMSREGLADRAGVSLKTIERIELGHVTPRRSTLAVIALALGVPIESLTERQAA